MYHRHICSTIIVIMLLLGCSHWVFAEATIADRNKIIAEELSIIQRREKTKVQEILDSFTVNDYVRIGLSRNPGLKTAFYAWKSAFTKIKQAFSLPDPQFTFTDYIEEVETRVGSQQRAYSLKQKFPLPDKLWLRKNKAFKMSEVAYYTFEKKRVDIVFQITEAFYEYAYLSKSILLTKENMKLLQNFESVAQTKYSTGMQKNKDLLKVQVELGKLENDLYSLEDLRSSLSARLNALLNLPEDTLLPWPNESLEDVRLEDEYKDVSVLVDALKEKNPRLRALSENVATKKESLKLAKREYFPDLTVGITSVDTDDALNPATIDSGQDPLMIMFSVNVPIWFGRLQAGVQDARASLKAAENKVLNAENELLSQLALVHYKMRDSLRQSHVYRDALIPKAMQTVNVVYSGYAGGDADFLSLIDAQRVLLNFQLVCYRHNANFYQRLSELQSLLGVVGTNIQEEL